MAMTINTNVVSINAQRNLGLSGGSLSTTMQRLSSGLRVNSAKDDAAGLAIAERMNAQSKGLAIAARNANDGISLAQTTEGALGKIGDMLQRQRELAVQASNATNSDTDRAALQSELSQLTSEIDRVAKTTSFNGQKVLDGSFSGGVFQVGASAGDNITIAGTTKATASGLGNVKFGTTKSVELDASKIAAFDKAVAKGALSIQVGNGAAVELSALKEAASGEERLGQMVAAINEKTTDTGVTAFLSKEASGKYTIALKSESAEPVQLKGFEASLGTAKAAAPAFDKTELNANIAAFSDTAKSTAADAQSIVDSINTAIGTETDSGIKANLTSAHNRLKDLVQTGVFATGQSEETFKAALETLSADELGALTTNGTGSAINIAFNATGPSTKADAEKIVSGMKDLLVNADGYKADGDYTGDTTSSASKINTAVEKLQETIDAAVTWNATAAGAFKTELANHVTTSWKAPDAVVAPAASNAASAANAAAYALSKDSTATEFNAALKGLTDAGWTGLKSAELTGTPTAGDVAKAVETLQAEIDTLGLNIGGSEVQAKKGIASVDITTQAGAWEAIKQIDSAIDQVNKARGDLGALQTRFEKSIENIDIQNENISAARGRIVDADFATETANLSRAQILQQAGTAMVAQANQLPQQVLSLLQ